MQTKRIQCPQCRVVLDIRNSKDETVKEIVCPSCQAALKVSFAAATEPLQAHTFYAPKIAAADAATMLATAPAAQRQTEGTASLLHEGKVYPLEEGQNIIGRKGNTSKATVQIETADRYMSRQHCTITLTTLPDGSRKAVLSNYQNKNLTTIDGQPIEVGDAIRLADGNTVRMGHTDITFKLS